MHTFGIKTDSKRSLFQSKGSKSSKMDKLSVNSIERGSQKINWPGSKLVMRGQSIQNMETEQAANARWKAPKILNKVVEHN